MIWAGWALSIMSLIAGSFATTVGTLIFTQGIMYGFGLLILYYPLLSMVNEWFVQKRGLAYGILCCGTGITGIAFPFIIEALLVEYGYTATLRALGVGLAVLTGPFLPYFRGRLPPSKESATQKTDWSFLRKPLFLLYGTSNLCQGKCSLNMPCSASKLIISESDGLLVSWSLSSIVCHGIRLKPNERCATACTFLHGTGCWLVKCVQAPLQIRHRLINLGQMTFGHLSDGRVSLHFLLLLSPLVSAIASFTLWGFGHSLPPLTIFSLVYGFFGAGYVVLWGRMGMALSDHPTAGLATYSVFAFQKGVTNVLAGPISASLILGTTNTASYGVLRYQNIVILTGVGMALSSLSAGAWYLKRADWMARWYTRLASVLLHHA